MHTDATASSTDYTKSREFNTQRIQEIENLNGD